jgi:hypothetical protein
VQKRCVWRAVERRLNKDATAGGRPLPLKLKPQAFGPIVLVLLKWIFGATQNPTVACVGTSMEIKRRVSVWLVASASAYAQLPR